jgi:hypothetical protein
VIIRRARTTLSLIWVCGALPLVFLLIARSINRFYSEELMEVWSWVSQLLIPILAIVVSSWSVKGVSGDTSPVHSPVVFWGALALSVAYILALYLVVTLEPIYEVTWVRVFQTSGIYLGVVQGVVLLALGKFFIENH